MKNMMTSVIKNEEGKEDSDDRNISFLLRTEAND